MKIVLSALIVLVLMIGMQSVRAESDASNTMPPGSKSASGDDVSGFAKLSPGEHYGQCEEVGQDNHLACESDLPHGYKQGIADAKSGQFPGEHEMRNRTGEYMDGYILGYCSVNHTATVNVGGRNCSQPIYPYE